MWWTNIFDQQSRERRRELTELEERPLGALSLSLEKEKENTKRSVAEGELYLPVSVFMFEGNGGRKRMGG